MRSPTSPAPKQIAFSVALHALALVGVVVPHDPTEPPAEPLAVELLVASAPVTPPADLAREAASLATAVAPPEAPVPPDQAAPPASRDPAAAAAPPPFDPPPIEDRPPEPPPPLPEPAPAPASPPPRRVSRPPPANASHGTAPAASAAAAPVPAPVAPAPAPAAPVVDGGWRNGFAVWLAAHRTYPDAARRDGVEGRATIRVTIARDGTVIAAEMLSSTGAPILDRAVTVLLEAIRRERFPFPPTMLQDSISQTVTLRYSLTP